MSPRLGKASVGSAGRLDRPVKDYFCLADGRTTAMINFDAGCDFWSWPRFDRPPRRAALLDSSAADR